MALPEGSSLFWPPLRMWLGVYACPRGGLPAPAPGAALHTCRHLCLRCGRTPVCSGEGGWALCSHLLLLVQLYLKEDSVIRERVSERPGGGDSVAGEDVVGGQAHNCCSEGHGARQAGPGSGLASCTLGQPHSPHLQNGQPHCPHLQNGSSNDSQEL